MLRLGGGRLLVRRPDANGLYRTPGNELLVQRFSGNQQSRRGGWLDQTACALADFPGHIVRQVCLLGLGHERERLRHPSVGEQVQEGRLLQLGRETLPQSAIEDALASVVGKVRQHHRIFRSQFGSPVPVDVCRRNHQNNRQRSPQQALGQVQRPGGVTLMGARLSSGGA